MNNATTEPSANGAKRESTAPSWAGKRVGRFRLVAELGRGAMGRVFLAEDTLLHRNVALKVLPQFLRRGKRTIAAERLVSEARAAATLDHPNVVTVYEVNESGGVYYIAMELLEGGSLRDMVKAAGPMDYARACLLCADAAAGLAQAHTLGIVHRDVKPANLMLTRSGRCKVVDFGLARIDDAGDLAATLSDSVGTPQFIAPELLQGAPASAQSDIYSLGGTLWFMLTGRPPFEGAAAKDILRQHLESPPPDLAAERSDAPPGLVQALKRALAKQPADRFASAHQLEKVLRIYTIAAESSATGSLSALAAGPVVAPSEPTHIRLPIYRRREVLIGAAALLVLAIAAIIGVIKVTGNSPATASDPHGTADASSAVSHVPQPDTADANPAPNIQPAKPDLVSYVSKAAVPPAAGKTTDLLVGLKLSSATVKGNWSLSNGELTSDSSGPAILELPVAVPSEYDFRIEFTPQDCVEQLLFKPLGTPAAPRGTAFNWCMGVGEVCGFEALNGMHVFDRSSPLTRRWTARPGERHTSIVKVRKDGVSAFLDGELVVSFQTDYHDLSRTDDWSMRENNRLGLGTWNKSTVFHKVELIDRTSAAERAHH
jgi:eukaryotic-like serine/threonine-protein kinase